jgi:Uma2 family endonuclease
MAAITEIGMSLEEFSRLYDEEPFELIDGERIPVSPQIPRSSMIAGNLYFHMKLFLQGNPLGTVFMETPFVLKPSKNWVRGSRVPDVMFVRVERLAELAKADPEWEVSPLPLVPDLVVEVMSPTDHLSTVHKKISRYMQDGVPLAWVIDPERRSVSIPSGTQYITLTDEGTLLGGEVLPGFSLPIQSLFE